MDLQLLDLLGLIKLPLISAGQYVQYALADWEYSSEGVLNPQEGRMLFHVVDHRPWVTALQS